MMADVPASPAVRRGWRGWAWGWIALGAAMTAWGGVFVLVLLVFASVGSPGDGDNALRSVRPLLLVTLSLTGTVALVCVTAACSHSGCAGRRLAAVAHCSCWRC